MVLWEYSPFLRDQSDEYIHRSNYRLIRLVRDLNVSMLFRICTWFCHQDQRQIKNHRESKIDSIRERKKTVFSIGKSKRTCVSWELTSRSIVDWEIDLVPQICPSPKFQQEKKTMIYLNSGNERAHHLSVNSNFTSGKKDFNQKENWLMESISTFIFNKQSCHAQQTKTKYILLSNHIWYFLQINLIHTFGYNSTHL